MIFCLYYIIKWEQKSFAIRQSKIKKAINIELEWRVNPQGLYLFPLCHFYIQTFNHVACIFWFPGRFIFSKRQFHITECVLYFTKIIFGRESLQEKSDIFYPGLACSSSCSFGRRSALCNKSFAVFSSWSNFTRTYST